MKFLMIPIVLAMLAAPALAADEAAGTPSEIHKRYMAEFGWIESAPAYDPGNEAVAAARVTASLRQKIKGTIGQLMSPPPFKDEATAKYFDKSRRREIRGNWRKLRRVLYENGF